MAVQQSTLVHSCYSTHTVTPGGSFNTIPLDAVGAGTVISNYAELSNGCVSFVSNEKVLFTIMPDGRIAKGEGFTTLDEMSIAFWDKVAENFPVAWWKSLIRDKTPKR